MRAFAFLDIETTGLDPDDDEILEMAWAFTDERFAVIGSGESRLIEPNWAQAAHRLNALPFVRDMHTASGLLDDKAKPLSLDAAMSQFLREAANTRADVIHIGGFSVHFDVTFLRARGYKAVLDETFHHRFLDLSAVKLLLEATDIPYESAPNAHKHRALHDVYESIDQARIFASMVRTLT